MSRIEALLRQAKGLDAEQKLLDARKASLKQEIDALYQLGEVGKKVQGEGMSATLTRTSTWKHSQNALDDIQKIKNFDIENGDAVQRVTESWTLRAVKEKDEQK